MGKVKDRSGERHGRLLVENYYELRRNKNKLEAWWRCRCECGAIRIIRGHDLDRTLSCGCWRAQNTRNMRTKHGMYKSSEFRIWWHMIERCHNPNDHQYPEWGGRGITVCDQWRESFSNFFADVGHRPSRHHSLDRIDNDGNYELNNVRWATRDEQSNNTRRTKLIEWNGKTQSVSQWERELGTSQGLIKRRLLKGWSIERAMTEPAFAGKGPGEGTSVGPFGIPEYRIWVGINARCNNPKGRAYKHYGGRGIYICERWKSQGCRVGRKNDQQQYRNFLEDVGRKPSKFHSLDRIDNNGPYACGKCSQCVSRGQSANCRWATTKEQMRNRRVGRRMEFRGQLMAVTDVAEASGINVSSITSRIDRGWSVEDATTIPPDEPRHK